MTYYFKLQYTRLFRWLSDLGIYPILGLIIGALVFVFISKYLFYKTAYANWIYLVFAISLLFKLNDNIRNDALKNIFPQSDYRLLRIIENSLIAIPFQAYLLLENEFQIALLLSLIAVLLTIIDIHNHWNKTIPTPFKKLPFEFIIGFRKMFLLIGFAYFLIIKAIQVDNYNLGLFGLGLIFLCSMIFYQKPEPKYFVWIYAYDTDGFLKKKFLTFITCLFILSAFALIGLTLGFYNNWFTTVIVYVAGYIFTSSIILAKYSAFPQEMNIPQGVLYMLSIMFPPIIVFVLWVFYKQSKKRLNPILEC